MKYVQPVFRPPSEGRSVLIQATIGCSNNTCTFCGSNMIKRFRVRPVEDIEEDIIEALSIYGEDVKRVFLLDANALCMKTDELIRVLDLLYAVFPGLERVGLYAATRDILEKTDEELGRLHDAGLKMAYLGIESGDEEIIEMICKGATFEQTVEACKRIMAAGITLSVTVILGLGGVKRWKEHARGTADILNKINPHYIGALTLMVVPGTKLYRQVRKGEFELLGADDILLEMRMLAENLDVTSVFRSNHASNYLPIGGSLPEDKDEILATIDSAILQTTPLRPDYLRRL